jgi:hypothetical protein
MGTYVRKRCHCDGQATFFIIVLLLLFVSSIGVCVYFYFAKEHMVTLHFEKVDALNQKIIALSEHIKEKDIENKDLKNSLVLTEKELADVKSKIQAEKDLLQNLTEIKNILDQQFLQVNDSLSSGFNKLDTFSLKFDSKIEDYLNKNKKELSTILKDEIKTDAVELPKVVVKPEDIPAPAMTEAKAPLAAEPAVIYGQVNPTNDSAQPGEAGPKDSKEIKVMKVNQKHAFLVINKGMIDGVKVGTRLDVYRHDVKIADALITEVRELVSLAKIEKQYEGHFIEEGDIARII